MGRDENSLTEWQREKKTTIILIKSIYNMQCSHHPMLSLLLSSKNALLQPAPHLNTEHDVTWYRTFPLIGCLGQPSQLLVKINSSPAEPRIIYPYSIPSMSHPGSTLNHHFFWFYMYIHTHTQISFPLFTDHPSNMSIEFV